MKNKILILCFDSSLFSELTTETLHIQDHIFGFNMYVEINDFDDILELELNL